VTAPVNPYADRPGSPGRAHPPAGGASDAERFGKERTRPVFWALCSLMVRTQLTRVRVSAVLGLCVLAILSGAAYGSGVRSGAIRQPLLTGAAWIDQLGLGFVVPVACLLFASSMFGDPNEDKTLVYLWLRPIPRARLTLAAAVSSFMITWPLVVPAMATTAALTGGGQVLVLATVLACTIAVVAYTGVFVALGARVKVPLVWGLLYIIIWEKYVASASSITKALSLRAYGTSTLSHFTGAKLTLDFLPLVPAVVVPLAIAAFALARTTRRLATQDVA
jgi:ABC-2 type transport system permease protein